MQWTASQIGLSHRSKTDPAIAKCICDTLRVCAMETKFRDFAACSIATAALEQDEIGWLDFTEGRISAQWKEAQGVYYASIGSSRLPWRWAQGLIQNLLSMVHKMWIAKNTHYLPMELLLICYQQSMEG